jgi:hypothetical protein
MPRASVERLTKRINGRQIVRAGVSQAGEAESGCRLRAFVTSRAVSAGHMTVAHA